MDKVLSLAPRIIIVSAIAVAFMKIFGNQGILITLAIVAALLTALYFYQNKLLYMPDIPGAAHSPKDNPQGYRHPSEHQIETIDVEIATADNVRIRGWLMRKNQNKRILVYFHQNAGNLGIRIPYLRNIFMQTQSDVLLVAYRGFSDSDGFPTEEGLQLDAQAILSYAIDYRAKQLSEGRKKDIYVLGRSLGGAVSIYLATHQQMKHQIKGLILENTFTSIQDMIKCLMPPLSNLQFMHRNFWPSKKRISQVQTPMLFVKSMNDEIVPPSQMSELIELAENTRLKMTHEIKAGTHNVAWQVDPPAYFAKFNHFFEQLA